MNITTLRIQACLSLYTLNFHETVFTISDGTIDLLSAIGIPDSKRGISYSVGLDGAPAFEFKENAVIKEPAQAYFKDQIYKDFAIGITVKPYKRTGGFLFAVKNLYNTVVQFGVELTGNQLKLHYTLEARYAKSSTVIATFDIGDIYNKWTKLSIKVKDNAVTLYKNCANLGSITSTPAHVTATAITGKSDVAGERPSLTFTFIVTCKVSDSLVPLPLFSKAYF